MAIQTLFVIGTKICLFLLRSLRFSFRIFISFLLRLFHFYSSLLLTAFLRCHRENRIFSSPFCRNHFFFSQFMLFLFFFVTNVRSLVHVSLTFTTGRFGVDVIIFHCLFVLSHHLYPAQSSQLFYYFRFVNVCERNPRNNDQTGNETS